MTTQLTARAELREKHQPVKLKISPPEKYSRERAELKPFLTAINLHCAFNKVPNNQEKILTTSMHIKGKAAI